MNIVIKLVPKVPIIDQTTKILFELTHLNNSTPYQDLNNRVTTTDHDGRLYKFKNRLKSVIDGKFSVGCIFLDDGEHRIIMQICKDATPFTVISFDLTITDPTSPSQTHNILKPLFDFFNSVS